MDAKKPFGRVLIIALVASMALAITASAASATIVKPANTKITASLASNVRIVSTNGYAGLYVLCKSSGFTFTTPTEVAKELFNTNRKGTGTLSKGAGSVTMNVEGTPTIANCGLYQGNPEKPADPGQELIPLLPTSNSGWTLAGSEMVSEIGKVGLAIPAGGFAYSYSGCNFSLSPSLITGDLTNSTHKLRLDGQVGFSATAGCWLGSSPAQFEAEYTLNNNAEILL